MYVYIQSEPGLYTVGFYNPSGDWVPESDHPTPEAAADRVNYLNGAGAIRHELDSLRRRVEALESKRRKPAFSDPKEARRFHDPLNFD